MKLMNEIKKESGIDINLNDTSEKEKISKLKFEPNLNMKRNFVPNLENENEKKITVDQTITNLNQSKFIFLFKVSSRFDNKNSLNLKKPSSKKDKKCKKFYLIFL